jgi:putative ABC transport system substrate-binding protein
MRANKKADVLSILFVVVLLAVAVITEAQQPTKIPRIGYISGTGNETNQGPYVEALRQGLRELGYIEGKNFTIEYRGAEGKTDRIPSLTIDLIESQVNVLIVATLPAILAAKQATKATPIIMVATLDPVANKLVDSLARPGGNLTGISTLAQDLNAKRLELLMEVVPRLSRVAVLRDTDSQLATLQFKEYEAAAATNGRNDALITITNANLFVQQKRLADLAIRNKLPSMFQGSTWVDSGGLMSYSTDEVGAFRRAAAYVDKILKGAKPADLPVEQMTKFEFVINLKTAKQIGLNIPQSVLFRADRVVR